MVCSVVAAASWKKRYNGKSEGLQMCLIVQKDFPLMTAREIVLHWRSRNTPSGFVLSDFKLFYVLKTMLTVAMISELGFGFHLMGESR